MGAVIIFLCLFIIMIIGHDTTSSAISWLFYTLASHPEHQHKCYGEVKTLMTTNDSQSLQW